MTRHGLTRHGEFVVRVQRLAHGAGLPLPQPQTAGSAGADLPAAVGAEAPITIEPGGYAMVPTGLALAIPAGWEGQVRPRSGLAARHGVTLLNSPGTIDSDYRGEVRVLLINHGSQPFVVRRGERVAQLVLAPVALADSTLRFEEVSSLNETERGAGGFGSTGLG